MNSPRGIDAHKQREHWKSRRFLFRSQEVPSDPVSPTKWSECELRTECDPRAREHGVGGGGASVWIIGRQNCELYWEADCAPRSCSLRGVWCWMCSSLTASFCLYSLDSVVKPDWNIWTQKKLSHDQMCFVGDVGRNWVVSMLSF